MDIEQRREVNKIMNNIYELISKLEKIGVIGSPSTTNELALDIMARSVSKKLVGELAFFHYLQENNENFALGQITEIKLRNIWHEDPTIRSLIRQRGKVDAVSERQDTHQGEMVISAVFADKNGSYSPSSLGTVPATGTPILLVNDEILDQLLSKYITQIFYLGHVYGSKPRLPLWFKHFSRGENGAGEAYHIGIFGKTGSGKSVLGKSILLAYAKHRDMGLFIIDPQGEFSAGFMSDPEEISMGQILCKRTLNSLDREYRIYNLSSFRLGTWELFGELLVEFSFFEKLGIKKPQYQEVAAEYVIDELRDKSFTLTNLGNDAFISALEVIDKEISRIYNSQSTPLKVKGIISEEKKRIADEQHTLIKKVWDQTITFFTSANGKTSIEGIISSVINQDNVNKPIIIIDLFRGKPSDISSAAWENKIKPLLINNFLSVLIRHAENAYKNNVSLNTLVVIDEASRFAPAGNLNNERKEKVRSRLIDAVRTTRKYGLGWMFLSQTLSSLDQEIIQQLRISFYGFGLSMGSEYRKLQEIIGGQGEHLRLYQQFKDPQSAFNEDTKEYSFMTTGPVSPLSFSGTPLFFNVFTDAEEFMKENGIKE